MDLAGGKMVSSQYSRWVIATLLALGLVLTGCGSSSGLSGTYHQAGGAGIITLEFNSGGKVTMTMMGESKQGTYEVKGDQVILHIPGEGDTQLKKNGDGTLDSGLGTFKKG
jgi:hypothetical protein